MKYRFLFLPLVAAVLLACSANIFACSCAFGGSAPCQEFWQADAVFSGTAVSSGKIDVDYGGFKTDNRLLRFTVDQPFRGMQSAEVEVITGWGGSDCGYEFKVGQRYLVYAYRDEKNNRLSTSICTRTRLLTEAAEDFAFIRALPASGNNGSIFGTVGKRNHQWKEGENWYKPVADVELVIEGEGNQYQAQSDSDGKFRVDKVLPGKYVVKLKLPPGLIRPSGKDESGMTAENDIEVAAHGCAETDFYLELDMRVRGRVLDAKGNPVAGMQLNMRGTGADKNNHNGFLYETTDADGNFEFKVVPPGSYWLGYHILNSALQEGQPYGRTYLPGVASRALATIVTLKEGQTLNGLTLQLPPPLSRRTVTGAVVWSDGQPVKGASIYINLMEDGEMTSSSTEQPDENGRFTLKLYEGLQYKISAYREGGNGRNAQSDWIDVPLTLDQPIRLVLPVQFRN